MGTEERNAFLATEHAEAIRYMDNAEATLRKAKKDDRYYLDKKYVRVACGTAYVGLLIAIDAWLAAKGVELPGKPRRPNKPGKKLDKVKSIGFYYDELAKLDGKMLTGLRTAYNILHLDGYYDGLTSVKAISCGFDEAYWLIDKIKPAAHA